MKNILSLILFLFLAIGAQAQTYYTFSISVTNVPANGATIANGTDTRTWTTGSITTPATQIAVAANPTLCASNLFFQTAQFQFAGGPFEQWDGGTNITYSGTNLAITASSGWATVTVVSTNGGSSIHVDVNGSGSYGLIGSVANQVYMASGTVDGINKSATNQFTTNCYALLNYVSLSVIQTIGNKTITNTLIIGGTNTNCVITNAINISGNVFAFTNGYWVNPTFTNAQNFGNPFRSPGGGTGSENFGVLAFAKTNGDTAFGDLAQATGGNSIAIGVNSAASGSTAIAIGAGSVASGANSFAVGENTTASGAGSFALGNGNSALSQNSVAIAGSITAFDSTNSVAIGNGASANFNNSTALGQGATTLAPHQVMLGTSSETTVTPGPLQPIGGVSNFTTFPSGTYIFNGALIIPATQYTGLINSNNADLVIGTNSYIQISGATGTFFTGGISGGSAGRIVTFENTSGQTWVVGNQFSSTVANRIINPTGADQVCPGTSITFWYDGTASRWKWMNHN